MLNTNAWTSQANQVKIPPGEISAMQMSFAKVKTVRALERGLAILRLLQKSRGATLHDLHVRLDLPKPTVLRLVRTLEDNGFVWRGLADGLYHGSYLLKALGGRLERPDRLVEVAGPVLDWLVARVQWPSDLSVRNGTFMQLRETSRMHSYFLVHRQQIGFRVNMALSAPGRAYLAFCPDRERASILRQLCEKTDPGFVRVGGATALERVINETLKRGYGIRDPQWGGHFTQTKEIYDDGLAAIAVPITAGARVLGCINIVWIARLFKPLDIANQHLADLKKAASLIALRYQGTSLPSDPAGSLSTRSRVSSTGN